MPLMSGTQLDQVFIYISPLIEPLPPRSMPLMSGTQLDQVFIYISPLIGPLPPRSIPLMSGTQLDQVCIYSAPSVYRPPFYRQPRLSPKFLSVPISPIKKIPCYTAKLSYRHPPQVFRHKSRKTNLNSPVSTAHNYPLTAVY